MVKEMHKLHRLQKIRDNRIHPRDILPRHVKTVCYLNTTPCQFTRSKTYNAMKYMTN